MNLHGIVAGTIRAVNPFIEGLIQISDGYDVDPNTRKQVPKYKAIESVPMQIQALSFRDLAQLDGLNLQGTRRKIYINGRIEGIIRAEARGGDLISFPYKPPSAGYPYGTVWLVAMVLEIYPDWCSVAVTLQNGE